MRLLACLFLASAAFAAEPASADKPLLHPLFSDEAVLQRGKPVQVWGWAAPGETVAVALAGSGLEHATAEATAGADGRWQAAIGPFTAGGPYILTATAGAKKAEAKDLLVGDVWLCTGQSNMEFAVNGAKNAAAEKADANWPRIRHIAVARTNAAHPEELIKGQWRICSPETVGGFTAVGYFFGRDLHQELKVPIGLIHSSWGGTRAECWTSAEALETLPEQAEEVGKFRKLVADADAQRASSGKTYDELMAAWLNANDPGTAAPVKWSDPAFDASTWKTVRMPAIFEDAKIVPGDFDGTVWLRRTVTVSEADAAKGAQLAIGKVDDADATYVNGRWIGGWEGAQGARKHKVPAGVLKAGDNLIAIRVLDLGNKGGITAKPEELVLTIDGGTALPLAGDWRMSVGVELAKAPPLPVRHDRGQMATSLYNGMIAPLVPYTLTGAIWYQGESNASRGAQYRPLLTTMIGDWRTRFAQGDFPFLIVSLANFQERRNEPGESGWAQLRESQARVAVEVPKAGLALAIDVGDAKDIHPRNKQEVGRRLALAARSIAYGQDIAWSGPWYASHAVEGSAIRLTFSHLGGGLVSSDGAPLTGFAIAGADGKFVWGEARIDGDSVVVSSPSVPAPTAVRYAWADNPACNLANKAGLPAVPFRTDVPKK